MCLVSSPKIPKGSKAEKPKDPAIIRNRYLDGIDPALKSLRLGRSALRIERTGVAGARPAPPPVVAPATLPSVSGPSPAARSAFGAIQRFIN